MKYEIRVKRNSGAFSTVECPTISIFVTELQSMLQTRGRGWRTKVIDMSETDDCFVATVGIVNVKGVTTDAE